MQLAEIREYLYFTLDLLTLVVLLHLAFDAGHHDSELQHERSMTVQDHLRFGEYALGMDFLNRAAFGHGVLMSDEYCHGVPEVADL